MKKIFLSLILVIFSISLFASTSPDGNDVVYLKNGLKVEGSILEQTATFIRMNVDSRGVVTIQMADIEKVVTQIADGGYNYTITSEYPNLPKAENTTIVTKPKTNEGFAQTSSPKKTYKPQPKSFFPDDVYDDLDMGFIVSNFYFEARVGLGSGMASLENMPYGLTFSYNHPGKMGRSYADASLAGGFYVLLGRNFGFDINLGYAQEVGVATYRDEFAAQGLPNPIIGMSLFDFYMGFLIGHHFRLGFTCALGSAYSSGDDWDDFGDPNYNPPLIYEDDMDAGSDFAFRWGVDLSYFFTPRFGVTVFGRSCDVDNRYTYYQPYPLNDIYIDNNSKHLSLGVELNFRIQPKCYNVKEVLDYEYHGSYSIEHSRVWKDCEE